MFKDRLKEARLAAKMTQAQLAKEVGVAKSTLAGYETGNSEPDLAKMEKIMAALHVDANFLWQDETFDQGGFATRLSYEELNLIQKYRTLDPHGKRVVEAVVSLESERCGNSAPTAEELQKRAIHGANLSEKSV